MADRDLESVDQLRYEWPDNILGYETKLTAGLTLQEIIVGILPFLACVFLIGGWVGIVLGLLAGAASFMSIKKLDALGGRSPVAYALARLLYAQSSPAVQVPLIVPSGDQGLVIENWIGETIMTVGGVGYNGDGSDER